MKQTKDYKKGYDKGYDEGWDSGSDFGMIAFVTILIISIIAFVTILIISIIVFAGEEGDLINTKEFGTQICGKLGLEYHHREIINQTPKIYCKEPELIPEEKKLIDSLVVKVE